jgi:hypothetical protein
MDFVPLLRGWVRVTNLHAPEAIIGDRVVQLFCEKS